MTDATPTLEEIIGRHRRGEGWIPGKHYMTQVDEDIAVLLDLIDAAREERSEDSRVMAALRRQRDLAETAAIQLGDRLDQIAQLANADGVANLTGQEPMVLVAETEPDDLEAWLG